MNSSLDLLHLAVQAAYRAGGYIREAERRKGATAVWESKGHNDWVTEVDRRAEELIREVLERGAPGSVVVGEELSPEPVGGGLSWIVDPLDGTTNFLHGYPQYAVSIAAAVDGVLEVAVILDVPRECFYGAVRGKGAWLGDTRLRVSSIIEPSRALLGTGYPLKRLEELE
ncbi:MAG: inositol monophosphatase, partial [Chloroflexota bacterium]|nr:inositol monophosphatase [Chloroflexota bacterium]